jgi:hypothetical protein
MKSHLPLFMLLVLAIFLIIPFTEQTAIAKRVPMGHPSLSVNLVEGPDPRFDFIIIEDEKTIESLKNDVDARLYGIFDMIILPEIRKTFDERRDIYSDNYVEGIWGQYDLNESKLSILIGKVPEEYGCNTDYCAHRIVTVDALANLKPANFRQVGFSIAVYESMERGGAYEQMVERILIKATTEAKVLFSEGASVLEDNKNTLLEEGTIVEQLLLRQYEDISRISVLFLPSELGVASTAKKPLDVVITSNSYYERSWSYNYSSAQSGQQPSPEMLQACEELGIEEQDCSDRTIAQKRVRDQLPMSDEEIQRIEDQETQINNSMYMIGIGAAIAGVIAFVTLRGKTR